MSNQNRYVAILGGGRDAPDNEVETFIIDGSLTVDALFALIDSKGIKGWGLRPAKGLRIHRDHSALPEPFADLMAEGAA